MITTKRHLPIMIGSMLHTCHIVQTRHQPSPDFRKPHNPACPLKAATEMKNSWGLSMGSMPSVIGC